MVQIRGAGVAPCVCEGRRVVRDVGGHIDSGGEGSVVGGVGVDVVRGEDLGCGRFVEGAGEGCVEGGGEVMAEGRETH